MNQPIVSRMSEWDFNYLDTIHNLSNGNLNILLAIYTEL